MTSRFSASAFAILACVAAAGSGWYAGRAVAHRDAGDAGSLTAAKPGVAPPGVVVPQVFKPGTRKAAWMARVKTAGSADFPGLFAELRKLFPQEDEEEREADPRHEAAVRFLIGHWLAVDVEAFMEFAPVTDYNGDFLGFAGELLGEAWPEKALAMLHEKGVQGLPERFIREAMRKVAELDPSTYLKFDPHGAQGYNTAAFEGLWSVAVKALATQDPDAAAGTWMHYRPSENHAPDNSALTEIMSAWQAKDPAAARAWAESLPDEGSRLFAMHEWMAGLARKSPAAAIKELGSIPLGPAMKYFGGDYGNPAGDAADARLNLARELAKRDLASALAVSHELAAAFGDTSDEHREHSLKLVRQWMVRSRLVDFPDEPAGFMSALAAMETAVVALDGDAAWWEDAKKRHLPERIAAWGIDECLTALRTSPEADSDVQQVLLQRAAEANPDLALKRLSELPAQTVPLMTKVLFHAWPESETGQRQELLARLPAELWDHSVMSALRGREAEFAPALADHPALQDATTVEHFVSFWAHSDPAAAAQWVAKLPVENGRPAASTVACSWCMLDRSAASSWVQGLEPGDLRDQAVVGLIQILARPDAESAREWALSIQSPEIRSEALSAVAAAMESQGINGSEAVANEARKAAKSIPESKRELSTDPTVKP